MSTYLHRTRTLAAAALLALAVAFGLVTAQTAYAENATGGGDSLVGVQSVLGTEEVTLENGTYELQSLSFGPSSMVHMDTTVKGALVINQDGAWLIAQVTDVDKYDAVCKGKLASDSLDATTADLIMGRFVEADSGSTNVLIDKDEKKYKAVVFAIPLTSDELQAISELTDNSTYNLYCAIRRSKWSPSNQLEFMGSKDSYFKIGAITSAKTDSTTLPETNYPDIEIISLPTNLSLVFNGKSQMPTGGQYTITGNNAINAGQYTAQATPKPGYFWLAPRVSGKTGEIVPTMVTGEEATESISWSITPATVTSVAAANVTYNGKAQTPKLTVKAGSLTLGASDFTVKWANNTNAGKATVTVTGKGNYTGSKSATFTIAKAANTLNAKYKKKTLTYKASKLKKRAQGVTNIKIAKAGQGKVTYKNVSAKKAVKKWKVNSKGKLTVPKGTKKGTYKVKIKVSAAGNANYKAAAKNVIFTVKVQ